MHGLPNRVCCIICIVPRSRSAEAVLPLVCARACSLGRLRFLRTDRDLAELWRDLGLQEDAGDDAEEDASEEGVVRPGTAITRSSSSSGDGLSGLGGGSVSAGVLGGGASVLRGSAGDAAARRRALAAAAERAAGLAASPGAAGNVRVLARVQVRR